MFIETPRFPDDISYGVTGGPQYLTEIVATRGGTEQRNAARSIGLSRFDAAHGIRIQSQMDTLNAFFRICRGQWAGFRFKDWSDYALTVTNGRLGASAVGTGFPTYQIYKRYTVGAYSDDRMIQKPVSLAVYKNAALQSSGYTLDTATGIVTFSPTATFGISAITKASPGLVTAVGHTFVDGDVIYVSGVTGMTELNGRVFTIGGVAGNNFNLGIATTTYNAYASAGSAAKYPQPADALTCAGEFDVPCRFATDEMQTVLRARGGQGALLAWESIPIQEIRL